MKRLIVNADDVGADEPRNAGIFEAIAEGVVTSVSILGNGTALENAVSRIKALKSKRVSYGIHLNLSEGKPVSQGLRLLVGADGCFLGKKSARDLLLSRGSTDLENEVRKELNAQTEVLGNAGIPIDHLDGHQHVHLFPAVLKVALNKAAEMGIRWVRIPDEPPALFEAGVLSPGEIEEAAFFSTHASAARARVQESGLSAPDNFRGLLFKGKLPSSYWVKFLESIPPGLTELMVHPGRPASPGYGPFSGFSTADRQGELVSLTDGRFRKALLKTGIELSPFPEDSIH